MVASTSIRFDFGGADTAPGTEQDIDALGPPTLIFKTDDDATIDAVIYSRINFGFFVNVCASNMRGI